MNELTTTSQSPVSASQRARSERMLRYLERDPANLPLRLSAIGAALSDAALDTARALIDEGLSIHPAAGELYLYAADIACGERALDSALAHMTEAIRFGSGSPAVRYNKAVLEFCLGRYADALAGLQGIDPDPRLEPKRRVLIARCLWHLGCPSEALDQLEGHEGLRNAEHHGVLAMLRCEAGLDRAALDAAEHALALDDTQLEALLARGGVRVREQRLPEARLDLERAVAAHPREGRAWFELSKLNVLERRFDLAAGSFAEVTAVWPKLVSGWQALAWARFLDKDFAAAGDALACALALDPNDAETLGSLALVALARRDIGEAERRLAEAERIDAGRTSVLLARALLDDIGANEGVPPEEQTLPAFNSALQHAFAQLGLNFVASPADMNRPSH